MLFKKILISLVVCLSTMNGIVQVAGASAKVHRHPHRNLHPIWYAPLVGLPHAVRARADCVMQHESTSTEAHPNLNDNNGNVPGQSGIFQMNNAPGGVWDTYVLPRLHVHVWNASAYQQAEGFVIVWRVDGFAPWHAYDGC